MRLDKFLSETTAFSRRELRTLIRRGAVTVAGVCVREPEYPVTETAEITLNGEAVRYRRFLYLMMNKPAGVLSATEDDRDPVVVDLIPAEWRHYQLFPVGRLDKDTEGLLILSNDGQFAHRVTAPRKQVFKRYFAKLDRPADDSDCAAFASGMDLGDFTAAPGRLRLTSVPGEVYVEIAEGKFHQVKRMCEKCGKNVLYLKRIAIGGLQLDSSLAPGAVRELTAAELAAAESGNLPPLAE